MTIQPIDIERMTKFRKMNWIFPNMESFRQFLKTLPEGYPPREIERLGFERELEEWLTLNSSVCSAFFAVSFHGEGKTAASGDRWKSAKLWKCLAVRVQNRVTFQLGEPTGFKTWKMTFVRPHSAPTKKAERTETATSPV